MRNLRGYGLALVGLTASLATAWTFTGTSTPEWAVETPIQQRDMAALRLKAERMMVAQTFQALPSSHQQVILAKLNAGAEAPLGHNDLFRHVEGKLTPETWDKLSPLHKKMVARVAEVTAERGPVLAMCFAPDTPTEVVEAFEAALQSNRFEQTARWGTTATDGGGLGQGDPTTLTYSFVPDGTFVPNLIGVTGNSDLFSFMNGIYGSPATWQAIYDEIFQGWGDLCGNTYVLEPNDDGVQLDTNPGVLGVRGDLRMAGIPIDGNSGTLAYNNFPEDGDMVIDTADNFYFDTSNNNLRLRNILYHEHGHGMGQLHVCPVAGTKLMEPFINLGFDGPQEDDILNAQRHYGDRFEHNDSAGTATSLGSLPDGNGDLDNLSCDSNTDVDYYAFTVPAGREITVTMTPLGTTYDTGPQTQQCNSGASFNALTVNNLGIDILDTDGSSVLATANVNGAGASETANANLIAAGTYYIRVFPGGTDNVQRYDLDWFVDTTFIEAAITITSSIPTTLTPGATLQVDADITEGQETVTPGSETLNYRFDNGSFQTITMSNVGGDSFTATIPAVDCGDELEWFVSAQASTSGLITNPASGVYSADVGTVITAFSDNFQTNQGWSASTSGGPSSGFWERGVPVNDAGWDFDPISDSDGSGQCYLTQNQNGNTDIDGGEVILTSPSIDLSDLTAIEISYDYFLRLTNTDGSDRILVEFQDNVNGGGWVEIARHDTDGGLSWRSSTVDLDAAGVTTSDDCQIRFRSNDADPQSINESGIDAVLITGLECAGCQDTDNDGTCDVDDGCPNDPNKTEPGDCGCGVADTDSDQDGTPDCNDNCPNDPNKIDPGDCGCGVADTDSDNDGTPDCNDNCPNDPNKIDPGVCGCGTPDTDSDNDGTPDCNDNCPNDPNKIDPGVCGCGTPDTDSDNDGTPDCNDNCPNDPNKTEPGDCGCGVADTDSDNDGTPDCNDNCPNDPNKTEPGDCGCGVADTDSDQDGTPDCFDNCPNDPNKTEPGDCGCGVADTDSDNDGTPDCFDNCPNDPNKTEPGDCGCGVADTDSDNDGTPDCFDNCPNDPDKTEPGDCGCGVADDDSDMDGVADCNDICPLGDDNVDSDMDGIPDACECPGDVDGDLDVDLSDLAELLAQFGRSGPGFSADLNGDGTVDLTDLAELLANFGKTCS